MNKNNPLFKAINDIIAEKKKLVEELKKLGVISIFSANIDFSDSGIKIEIKCRLNHFVDMTISRCYPSYFEHSMSQEISYKIESGYNQNRTDFAKVQSSLAKAIKELSTMKSLYDNEKEGSNG